MNVIYGLEHLKPQKRGVVLSIGNFDGLHLGHQKILKTTSRLADRLDCDSFVLTFEFHPLRLRIPQKAPAVLMPLKRRIELISRFGIDCTVILHCREEILDQSAEEFIGNLVENIPCKAFVEGVDFRFGREREGDIDTLCKLGKELGFDVHIVEPVELELDDRGKVRVSSTLIRELISVGNVKAACRLLGRHYEISGRVVYGSGRGRMLGFPTANIGYIEELLPSDGVYAAFAHIGSENWPAAVNVGPAPSFSRFERSVEAHLIGFDGDLYDRDIRIEFVDRIRDVIVFRDIKDLSYKIKEDILLVSERLKDERSNVL